MPSYSFEDDVTEWLDELGGAEPAEQYLSSLAERCAKAGEANKAYYYRKIAAETGAAEANAARIALTPAASGGPPAGVTATLPGGVSLDLSPNPLLNATARTLQLQPVALPDTILNPEEVIPLLPRAAAAATAGALLIENYKK